MALLERQQCMGMDKHDAVLAFALGAL
ncbi:hypothetical protein THF5H11_30133 [Vibrio jasicida]|nr:hypothetical protein THF5H11_30133 [Vibrio jasicida]